MVERSISYIPLLKIYDGTQISIPLVSYGSGGKRVLIVTPLHGNEITSIYLLWRLMEYIESGGQLKGSLDILMGVNYYGLLFNKRVDPLSGMDLNRSFPGGDEYGTSGHIARVVYELAKKGYDFVIDLHGAGYSIPHIILDDLDLAVVNLAKEVAESSGIPYVWDYYDMEKYYRYNLDRTLPSSLLNVGVASFTYEIPTEGLTEKRLVDSFNGLVNILSYLEVLEDENYEVEGYPRELYGLFRRRVHTEHGGFIIANKEPGEYFVKYEDLVIIKNILGEVMERVRMPRDGYVISIRRMGVAKPYEGVAIVGIRR